MLTCAICIREELKAELSAMQTEEERNWRATALSGRGPTNHMTSIRLFDAPDGFEPLVTLYRYVDVC
jgi:glutathione S-transferase